MMNSPKTANGTPLIQLRQVSKVYSDGNTTAVSALEEITFTIHRGELVTAIGPSGCGKTTLLNLIAGFDKCTSGTILVDGRPIQGPSPDRTMIFQEHNLFPWKTVMQNVEFGLKACGLSSQERIAIAQQYIDLVQLSGFEDKFPHQLSGGMRQRVAIARALVLKPTCILMDEPFAALDAQLHSRLQDELLSILATEKHTILFITHDIEEAIYLSDRVMVISQRPGRLRHQIDVPLPRPRHAEMKLSPAFQALKAEIRTTLEG